MSAAASFERVLVALDASPQSRGALEAAIDVASRLDAEIVGVFVEDAELLRLAELPTTREVTSFSASIERLDPGRLHLQLRAMAERMRRSLAASAERARLRWSFRVARGSAPAAVLDDVAGGDLVAWLRTGGAEPGAIGVGGVARAVLAERRVSALVVHRAPRMEGTPCALYDGSPAGRRALEVVARLARGGSATIVVAADDERETTRLEREAGDVLRRAALRARIVRLVGEQRVARNERIRAEASGLIVLPAAPGDDLTELLVRLDAPVLVVREPSGGE